MVDKVYPVPEQAKKNSHLNIISDQTGAPTYADDLASAILHIINSKKFVYMHRRATCGKNDSHRNLTNAA